MRQVFAVGGGRSCLMECRSSRKRSRVDRDLPSRRNGVSPYQSMQWEEYDDEIWDEEEGSLLSASGGRSVMLSASGSLTIRARTLNTKFQSPPRNAGLRRPIQDLQPLFKRSRERKEPRKADPYDLWDLEEEQFQDLDASRSFYDEYEGDRYRRSVLGRNDCTVSRPRRGQYRMQEEYDEDMGTLSPPRSLGPISVDLRRKRVDEHDHLRGSRKCGRMNIGAKDYPGAGRQLRVPKDRRPTVPRTSSKNYDEHHHRDQGTTLLENSKESGRNEDIDLPPGFGHLLPAAKRTDSKSEPNEVPPKAAVDHGSYCGDQQKNCQTVGHVAGQCPTKEKPFILSTDEPSRKTCFTCGQMGHFSFQCPSRASEVPKPAENPFRGGRQCYTCGDFGHVSYACPMNTVEKEQAHNVGEKRCDNCYETGHLLCECPMLLDSDALKNEGTRDAEDALYKTKLSDAEKHRYLKENRCFTCGHTGHPYYCCPQSERRLEFIFGDREYKASFKILRTPCWNYMDDNGFVHGPVSLHVLASRLEDGYVHEDMQAQHLYENLEPISVGSLVSLSKCTSSVGLLNCMPEAAGFLCEEMDASTCKANMITALQTKIHYNVFQTTVRWLFISILNESLHHFRRNGCKKTQPQIAEDYCEPDWSGPPHSSDCESLDAPPGSDAIFSGIPNDPELVRHREMSFQAMMLIECDKYVSEATVEDPMSNSLAAIQTCLHRGVVAAPRGLLDVIIGEYFQSWIQQKKDQKVEIEYHAVPEVACTAIPEEIIYDKQEDSEPSKGTSQSSPESVEAVDNHEKMIEEECPPVSSAIEEECPPVSSANLESVMRDSYDTDKAPELVLHFFRKTKKVSTDDAAVETPTCKAKLIVPAKKRILRLCELADAKAAEEPLSPVTPPANAVEDISPVREEKEGTTDLLPEIVKPEVLDGVCPQSTGCARSSICGWDWRKWSRNSKSSTTDNFSKRVKITGSENTSGITARSTRAQVRKLAMANQLKARKKMLKFQRSKIHAWGVVALEPIEPEDFIVEYIGELVRPKVADLRESRYEKQGLGSSYLFRVGEGYVIDATLRGGLARFINHSCEPNCYTKIITVDGRKRVFIYAKKYITPGTELTYDYKFPREDEKIPCLCGAARCRGFLN